MIPVIDSHRHVWDQSALTYPWMQSATGLAERVDLGDDPVPAGLRGVVLVEAGVAPGSEEAEWRFLHAAAHRSDVPVRIVVALDRHATTSEIVRSWRRRASVAGVRITLGDLAAEGWDGEESRRLSEIIDEVHDAGLSVDVLANAGDLSSIRDLFDGHPPAGAVVLDHLGNPPVGAGILSEEAKRWQDDVGGLARHPSLCFKLSGLPAAASTQAPMGPQCAPFLQACAEAVPSGQLMLGSDWPVSQRGDLTRPEEWFELVRTSLRDRFSEDVAWRTAARVYGFEAV